MPVPQTGAPPMSPDVAKQQQPALAQYAQGATANGAGGGGKDPSDEFVAQALKTIAEAMGKVAKVLQVKRPELIPVLKQMAAAGKMLETEFSKTQGQSGAQQPSNPGSEPSQTDPEGPESVGLN